MDIDNIFNLRITEEDIAEIKKVDGVLNVFPTYTLDAIIKDENSEKY